MNLNDLKELIATGKPALQQHALQIWEKEWSKQPEILFAALQSNDTDTLTLALDLSAAYYPEKSASRIVKLLESKNPTIRRLAVQALTPAMIKAGAEGLKDLLKKEKDVFVLASAVTAAARLGFNVATIEPFLRHKDIRLRANSVRAAAVIGRERLRELLEPMLKDSSHRVQNEALKGLAQLIPETELEKLVLRRLKNEDSTVRAATAFLIGELPLSRKVGFLLDALKDQDERVVVCAVRALVRLDDPIGMRSVVEMYLHTDQFPGIDRIARIISPVAGERLLNAADKHAHPAEADSKTVHRVLLVARQQKNHEPFLPWLLAALRKCNGEPRMIALQIISASIDYFKHDVENLLDISDPVPDEQALKNLILWKAGKTSGLEQLKMMLFSGRAGDVAAAARVLRQDNSLISRNYLKQAANSGILLAMEPETFEKNLGSKPIRLPEI